MSNSRRQRVPGGILEQFAELKSDYEIGKASRYKRAKTGIMTLGSHADYHYRTESAYFGAMEIAREMTRNNPLVMQPTTCATSVSFPQACMNFFSGAGMVGCRSGSLRRTADGDGKDNGLACRSGKRPATV